MTPDIVRQTLNKIEQSQRRFQLALAAGVMVEALLIGAMLLVVNFSDRTQALIFISAVGGYTLIALGLVMLAAHVDRTLLRAVQMAPV